MPFDQWPAAQPRSAPLPSHALNEKGYRKDAAAHLYSAFPDRVWHGRMPPLLHAVLVIDTEVDAQGAVRSLRVVRAPAGAKEVTPWVLGLVRRATPLPPPRGLGHVTYREVWLVHRSGRFQLDALSEGQD
ncbi:MAG: hypothetical protein ABIR94_03365 [Rubrivivax sp.]